MVSKKIMSLILTTSMISMNTITVLANESQTSIGINNEISNNIKDNVLSSANSSKDFEFDKATGTITKYRGNETEVDIPSEIDGVSVTSIGNNAFSDCIKLKRIVMPDTIETIGKYAFYNCSNLIYIDNLSNVTRIESGTFLNCRSLKNIKISTNISYIDETAFNGCSNLLSIEVDENNKNYESKDGVLFNKSMTSLIRYPEGKVEEKYIIPNDVVTIEEGAFSSCNNLNNIEIPESVESIEENAFYDCHGLKNITISSKVKSLKDSTFSGCSNLKSVELLGELTSIGHDVFYGCSNVEVIKIPYMLTNSKDYKFYGESEFKSLESSKGSRVFIEHSGVEECDSAEMLLKKSGIDNRVKIIESYENNITTYSKVEESDVTTGASIQMKVNHDVNMLNFSLLVESDNTGWKTSDNFKYNNIVINGIQFTLIDNINKYVSISGIPSGSGESVILPNEIECAGEIYKVKKINSFLGWNDEVENITIPDSVTNIEKGPFLAFPNLKSINVDQGNKYYEGIDGVLFNEGETELIRYPSAKTDSNYTVPNSVKVIDAKSFSSNADLKNIKLVNGITSIGAYAFAGCRGLTSMDIPNSVTGIGKYAFSYYSGISEYIVHSENVKTLIINNGIDASKIKVLGESDSTGWKTSDNFKNNNIVINGIQFTLSDNINKYVSISGIPSGLGESVILPNEIECAGEIYKVKSINSFLGWNDEVENITIPDSVTNIEKGSFLAFPNLKSINVDQGNKYYEGIDGVLFNEGETELIRYPAGKTDSNYTVPNSVKVIDAKSFSSNADLKDIKLVNGITSIGAYAFAGCRGLTSMDIPNSVTDIGKYAFSYYSGISEYIVHSENVKTLLINNGIDASKIKVLGESDSTGWKTSDNFKNNNIVINGIQFTLSDNINKYVSISGIPSGLGESVILPNEIECAGEIYKVKSINSFLGWNDEVENITIPDSVTNIEKGSFLAFPNLKSINVDQGNKYYEGIDGVLFNEGETELIRYPAGKTDSNYTVPNSVKVIDAKSFSSNADLKDIKLVNGITSIGAYAFAGCRGLTSMDIPNSVTGIGKYAFSYYSGISEYIVHSENVKTLLINNGIDASKIKVLGESDSTGWKTSDNFKNNNIVINGIQFTLSDNINKYVSISGIPSGLGESVILPNEIECAGEIYKVKSINSFLGWNDEVENITIPDSVTNIEKGSFLAFPNLKSINVDQGNKYYEGIDGVLFNEGETELIRYPAGKTDSNYTVPNSVKVIDAKSFSSNADLKDIKLVNGITSIGAYAFAGCRGLTSMDIPNSVTDIGKYAFSYYSGISEYIVHSENVKTLLINNGIDASKIKVLGESDNTGWKTSNNFKDNKIVINGIQFTLSDNVNNYVSISGIPGRLSESAILPNEIECAGKVYKVTSISGWPELHDEVKNITIPDSITNIYKYAFSGFRNLESIKVDPGNKYYEEINGVLFNEAETELIRYPIGKTGSNYIVPNSVKTIDANSFSSNLNLKNVELVNGITSIASGAFGGCIGLTSMDIPNSVTSIGNYAFPYRSAISEYTVHSENVKTLLINSGINASKIKVLGESDNTGWKTSDNFKNNKIVINGIQFTLSDNVNNYVSISGIPGRLSESAILPNEIECAGKVYKVTSISGWPELHDEVKNITIPDSITNIYKYAFSGFRNLESIKVDPGNKYYEEINGVLFNEAETELIRYPIGKTGSNYIVPNSVKTIDANSFSSNLNLKNVELVNGITSIASGAFGGCIGLTSMDIPNSVTSIGKYAFPYRSAISEYTVHSENVKTLLINSGIDASKIKVLGESDNTGWKTSNNFKDNKIVINGIQFTLSDSVNNYVSISGIPGRLSESAILPNEIECAGKVYKVTSISGWPELHDEVKNITIPDSITNIYKYAFSGFRNLESIKVDPGNKYYEEINGVLFNEAETELIRYPIGKTGSNYIVPNSVKTIDANSFSSNIKLKNVELLNGITSIESGAFGGCIGLTSMDIPNSVTSIGNYAFPYRSAISEYIVHSENVKTLLINSGIDASKVKVYNSTGVLSSDKQTAQTNSSGSGSGSGSSSSSSSKQTTQTYNGGSISQYVSNAIIAISGGQIKDKKNITTQNGKSAEVITISMNNNENAQLITTSATDVISIKADANKSIYVYIEELGLYKKVDSQVVGNQITFNAEENNVYLVGDGNTVGTKVAKDGWNNINGFWYVINSDGSLKTGWYNEKGTWYNLATNGKMNTGWFKDTDGKYYLFAEDGSMQTGWHNVNGEWYFMNSKGEMATGWIKDSDDKWYYLKENGSMAHDEYINGYYVSSNGEWINN